MKSYWAYIFITVNIFGCASLPKESLKIPKTSIQDNLCSFDGKYEISRDSYYWAKLHQVISLIYKNPDQIYPTDTTAIYFLRIKSNDNKKLTFCLDISIDNTSKKEIISNTYEIRSIKDNYIYLKEKRMNWHGFPFILGGYNYSNKRLAIDNKGNLIIDSVTEGKGAFLFLIWSETPVSKETYIYEKININDDL